MADRRVLAIVALVGMAPAILGVGVARAQEAIGSTTTVQNQVTRELQGGGSGPLTNGDSVFRNEAVKTGADSLAKLVFLDSTNLSVGPTSRVVLDRFVYVGESNGQKMAVNLAKGIFRFTTGGLDKKAYTIDTPTAAIGVRGTVLDINVRNVETRVTLREGLAVVCPRHGKGRCVVIDQVGETASVKRVGGTDQAGLTSDAVNFAALCSGGGSLCSSESSYASNSLGGGGGVLCGR